MHVSHPMTSVLGAASHSTHSCYQELIRNRGFMRDRKQHTGILPLNVPWQYSAAISKQNAVWFQGKPFSTIVMPKKLKLTGSTDLLELTPKKDSFHHRGLECKSRKSRDTWSNRQVWSWSTNESGLRLTVLPREHTVNNKHSHPTTQESTIHMDITRWSIPKSDWLYYLQPKIEKIHTISKNKTRSWLWLRSCTPYCQTQT